MNAFLILLLTFFFVIIIVSMRNADLNNCTFWESFSDLISTAFCLDQQSTPIYKNTLMQAEMESAIENIIGKTRYHRSIELFRQGTNTYLSGKENNVTFIRFLLDITDEEKETLALVITNILLQYLNIYNLPMVYKKTWYHIPDTNINTLSIFFAENTKELRFLKDYKELDTEKIVKSDEALLNDEDSDIHE